MVFTNLLNNALKYTPRGGGCDRYVQAKCRIRRKGALHIAVTDNGCGIPPEYRERMFDKFFRIEQLTGHRSARHARRGDRSLPVPPDRRGSWGRISCDPRARTVTERGWQWNSGFRPHSPSQSFIPSPKPGCPHRGISRQIARTHVHLICGHRQRVHGTDIGFVAKDLTHALRTICRLNRSKSARRGDRMRYFQLPALACSSDWRRPRLKRPGHVARPSGNSGARR